MWYHVAWHLLSIQVALSVIAPATPPHIIYTSTSDFNRHRNWLWNTPARFCLHCNKKSLPFARGNISAVITVLSSGWFCRTFELNPETKWWMLLCHSAFVRDGKSLQKAFPRRPCVIWSLTETTNTLPDLLSHDRDCATWVCLKFWGKWRWTSGILVVSPKFPDQFGQRVGVQRNFVEAEEDDVGYSIPEAWYSRTTLWGPMTGLTGLVFSLWTGCRFKKSCGCLLFFSDLYGLGFQNLRCWIEFVDAQVCSILQKKNKAIWWWFCGPHEEW